MKLLKKHFITEQPTEKTKTKSKFYDFWQDGITQSMISAWLNCPKQAYYEYVVGALRQKQQDTFLFGNICHHVMQRAYSSYNKPHPGNVITFINEYKDFIQKDFISAEAHEHNELSFAKAEAVMLAYFLRYDSDFQDNWELTEHEFKVPYVYPDGKTTYFRGMVDAGFIRKEQLWLMDHKCQGRINIDNTIKLLPVDLQLNIYYWCICWLIKHKKLPFNNYPSGFYYNIIRNPQSKLTKKDANNYDKYTQRIKDDVMKDPDHYFFRVKMTMTLKEVNDWKKSQLDFIMRDIRKWVESNYTWPEYYKPTSLLTHYGTLSDYADIVLGDDMTVYHQKDRPFMELSADCP